MSLGHFTTTLKRAACVSIPHHKTEKKVKSGPIRIWNPEIGDALKRCKEVWWHWKQSGEPSDNKHWLRGQTSNFEFCCTPTGRKKLVYSFQSGTCLGVLLRFLWSMFCKWPAINVTQLKFKIVVHKIQD